MQSRQYFIYLLSCFLSNKQPEGEHVDWQEIYNLGNIHDVSGIIAYEIKLLPEEYRPVGNLNSCFNQSLGLTIQNTEQRQAVKEKINGLLDSLETDRIFVKGSVIRQYYPVPELRTSGDIDIIVRPDEYERITDKLSDYSQSVDKGYYTTTLYFDNIKIELHRDADVFGNYFENIFDLCRKNGHLYELSDSSHLLYTICHLLKHLSYKGAGIRMLMDIDAIIRNMNGFDYNSFISLCSAAGIEHSSKILLELCRQWLDTPVGADFDIDERIISLFEKIMLDGGSFGDEINNLGGYYLTSSLSSDNNISTAKLKALIRLAFPKPDEVRTKYDYSVKHKFLLPFAYLNRAFDAVFRRKSLTTVNQIIGSDSISLLQAELLSNLDIKE